MAAVSAVSRPFVVRVGSWWWPVDAAVAFAAFGATLALLHHGGLGPLQGAGRLDTGTVALAAASTLPLAAWRRSPEAVFLVVVAATVASAARGEPVDLTIGAAVALYLLAASRDERRPWTVGWTVAVLGLFAAYLGAAAAGQRDLPGPQLLHSGFAWAAAWFAGERTRLRHEHIVALHERARRAERDAERERLLAAAEERARIARDLHDSAGHAISVIAVRAGAARLRHDEDPDRTRAALQEIEDLARRTAGEIDHIVGTLRDRGDGGVEAPPGLASLGTLVDQQASAGLDVSVEVSGPAQRVGDAADQAAYRILQEALTNARRHGSGPARVTVAFTGTGLELTVTNPVAPGGSAQPGGGHGLVGMRERATLLGGHLDAGGRDGTFRVEARIPLGGEPR